MSFFRWGPRERDRERERESLCAILWACLAVEIKLAVKSNDYGLEKKFWCCNLDQE